MKHIHDETEFLLRHYQSLEFQGLLEDEVLQRACLRSLEVIGEGVKNVSEDFKADHPDIEWRKIARMRDMLIHHYFGVDWQVVWNVLEKKLPQLNVDVKRLIDEEEKA